MKRSERRRIRIAVDRMCCPECRAYRLEIISLKPPSALCNACGWFGDTENEDGEQR